MYEKFLIPWFIKIILKLNLFGFINKEAILTAEFRESFATPSSFLIGSLDHFPESTLLPSMIALSITIRVRMREEAREKEKERSACGDARFDKSLRRPFKALPPSLILWQDSTSNSPECFWMASRWAQLVSL